MLGKNVDNAIERFRANLPAGRAKVAGHARWLLVSCIDYRYHHVIHNYMKKTHPQERYDQLVLAGASLAASDIFTTAGPIEWRTGQSNWRSTFLEHVNLAIALHDIEGVLIINHRTCGAFKKFEILTDQDAGQPVELDRHRQVATQVVVDVATQFRRKSKSAYVLALLAPIVTDPDADDFPSVPEFLYEMNA
jgi:hypothetical protein